MKTILHQSGDFYMLSQASMTFFSIELFMRIALIMIFTV